MLDAAVKALAQILSPPMRSILWRSIGLALVLITVLAIGLQRLLSWFATSGEGWAEAMLGVRSKASGRTCASVHRGAPPRIPRVFWAKALLTGNPSSANP